MDDEDKMLHISIRYLKSARWHVCFPRLFSCVRLSCVLMIFLISFHADRINLAIMLENSFHHSVCAACKMIHET